ncbi:MAG: hypothetical protein ACREOY_01270 [Candidatus Dormibacteraceae bacterium]
MKVTIALLVVYVLTLVIEVPIGLHMLIEQDGAVSAIWPASPQLPGSLGGAIEAIFVALMIVFIRYSGRGMRWSYIGAMVVGIVHAILSAAIVVIEPWGEPLSNFTSTDPPLAIDAAVLLADIAVFLTVLPAFLAIAAGIAVLELGKRAPS